MNDDNATPVGEWGPWRTDPDGVEKRFRHNADGSANYELRTTDTEEQGVVETGPPRYLRPNRRQRRALGNRMVKGSDGVERKAINEFARTGKIPPGIS